MVNDTQTVVQLEKLVKQLVIQNRELNQRIIYLERENLRRRNEVQQLASAVNKRNN